MVRGVRLKEGEGNVEAVVDVRDVHGEVFLDGRESYSGCAEHAQLSYLAALAEIEQSDSDLLVGPRHTAAYEACDVLAGTDLQKWSA